jgi:hypothetical protein
MRVERLPEYVTTVTVTAAGIAFALYCGTLTGSGQTQVVMMIFGLISALTILLTLRGSIWVLIPLAWALTGVIPPLPVPLALRDVVILFVLTSFFLLKALKVVRFRPVYTRLDALMLANLLYLATVFVRNPVGTYIFESERVGGRPYLNVAIAFAAFLILCHAHAGPRLAKLLPFGMVLSSMVEGILSIVADHFPRVVPVLSRFYGSAAFAPDTSVLSAHPAEGSGRNPVLRDIGHPLLLALYSKYNPVTLLNPLYIVRFTLFVVGLAFVLFSGFRMNILAAGAGFMLVTYFRGGGRAVLSWIGVGTPILILLVLLQGTLFELPRPAQRALSFLPGKWDPIAVAEAKHSTDWRLYMWKNVWNSDRYIQNKVLGDGFGFSTIEMSIMARGNYQMSPEETQETYMVMGEYHSGPLSAIRDVGYVGLALFLWLLVALAREGWVLIRRAQGGPYEFLSYFIAVPLIFEPFQFVVIYGSFKENITVAVVSVGLVKMLKNSLDHYDETRGHSERQPRHRANPAVRGMKPVSAAG